MSCYVRYSPRYFRDGVGALYAEIDGSVPLNSRWRVLAHVGVLTPIAAGAANAPTSEEYDGSLGVSTLFRRCNSRPPGPSSDRDTRVSFTRPRTPTRWR